MANAGEENVGIATVYRTVRLLLESGRIRSVTLPTGSVCYERSELGHHHHFHCHRCDRVFDLKTCPVHIQKKDLPKGFTLDSHDITLTGLCADCQEIPAKPSPRPATVRRRRIRV
jgi:Fur family ferric uptake transcriptional regulator